MLPLDSNQVTLFGVFSGDRGGQSIKPWTEATTHSLPSTHSPVVGLPPQINDEGRWYHPLEKNRLCWPPPPLIESSLNFSFIDRKVSKRLLSTDKVKTTKRVHRIRVVEWNVVLWFKRTLMDSLIGEECFWFRLVVTRNTISIFASDFNRQFQ